MNKKFFTNILSASLASVVFMSSAIIASAAADNNYTEVTGTNNATTFEKYLVLDKNAEVPNVEFKFSIAPGEGKPATDSTVAILPGVGNPVISNDGKAVFALGDTTILAGSPEASAAVQNLDANEKYAVKSLSIDFSGVTFTEPGIYRYIITEDTTDPIQGIIYDSDSTRVLDVYVVDVTEDTPDAEKTLKIDAYILHANDGTLARGDNYGTADADNTLYVSGSDYKSRGYTNEYETYDLEFKKVVEGNQASKDKYFKFTLNISGAPKNMKFNVDISGAEATSGTNAATVTANENQTNVTSFTTDANGNAEVNFYLQHGQSISVQGLTKQTKWTVTEDNEDYKATVDVTGETTGIVKNENTAKDEDGITADTNVVFTNTRKGTVPTGIMLSVAPFAVITLAGVGGLTVMLKKKNKSE